MIELPLLDYINKYEKNKNKLQNERNIRVTIPARYCDFVKTLCERGLDAQVLDQVLLVIFDALSDRMEEKNALRLAKAFVK